MKRVFNSHHFAELVALSVFLIMLGATIWAYTTHQPKELSEKMTTYLGESFIGLMAFLKPGATTQQTNVDSTVNQQPPTA
jgi:hypothetical protein